MAASDDDEQAAKALANRRLVALRNAMAPIIEFLEDDSVIEIMLNADGAIWVERVGMGMVRTETRMSSSSVNRMLLLVAASADTELNDKRPSLSAKLPFWGARLQAAIPPIVKEPVFALRKPAKIVFSLDQYVGKGIMSAAAAEALRQAVVRGDNILVGGGTGSGKTTLTNALLQVAATTKDRIHIVEDTLELQCVAENRLEFLVQPPVYSWQQAMIDAMRWRPDRIIMGEVRDGAALELINAWNTGHSGMATLHANSTSSMLTRVCQLMEQAVPRASREFVADAVNVCVHITREPMSPVGRRLTGIDRVLGVDGAGGWKLEPLV